MATRSESQLTCSEKPFRHVILMILDDVWCPFKVIPNDKVMTDGRTLQESILHFNGFDIAQQLSYGHRTTPVLIDGVYNLINNIQCDAYIFIRIQEGK
jgi:hypothetical protein